MAERSDPARGSGTEKLLLGLLLAAAAGLLWVNDLNSNRVGLYSMLGLGFVSLVALGWIYHRRQRCPSLRLVLGVSLGLRVLLIPLEPSLSNDVQRYLWDGHVVVSGENPYALAPADTSLERLRVGDEPQPRGRGRESSRQRWQQVWQAMSHRTVETVYPPLAMSVFSIAALASDLSGVRALWLYKGLLVTFDLLGCWLLFLLAKRSNLPVWRTILYAWNPLVVLEVSGMGHIDGAGLLPVAMTLLLLDRAHRVAASWSVPNLLAGATAAVAAVAVKLVPIVALPFWSRYASTSSRGRWFAVGVVALLALTFLPVVVSVGGVPPGLVTYGVSWEFNGPLFEPLYRLVQVGSDDRSDAWLVAALKGTLARVDQLPGLAGRAHSLYGYLYPQLLTKVGLAVGLVAYLLISLRRCDTLLVGTRRVFAAGLLCIATVYPWYLLWVLPWAALTLSLPWLVASASLTLAYLPRLWGLEYFPVVYLLVWLPPTLTVLFRRLQRQRSPLPT